MANSLVGGAVVWTFEADTQKFIRATSKVRSEAGRLASDVDKKTSRTSEMFNRAGEGLTRMSESAGRAVNRYSKILGVATIAAATFAIKSASDYEQSRIAFDTMLGSAEAGAKMLKNISKFARRTPFELPEVVTGAKQLLAYNIAGEKVLPTLEALGNISAGVGKDKLPNLILAFGQVKAATRLTGMELRQFTEAGVPLIKMLADQLGKTEAQIKDMVSEGEIGFPEVEKAIFGMSKEGGKFFKLMDKQSKTFGGVVSNIKDNIGRLARSIVGISEEGEIRKGSIFARLAEAGQKLLTWIEANSDNITKKTQEIVDNMMIMGEKFAKDFKDRMQSDGFATALTGSLIALVNKIDWMSIAANAVKLAVAITPLIIIGFGKGLLQAAMENPLNFITMFALLGFMPAVVTGALATVLGGIPIVGPIVKWGIMAFGSAARLLLSPIRGLFLSMGNAALSALAPVIAKAGAKFLALKAIIMSPIVMPAIVVAAALASLALVVKAIQTVKQAINDVNNAARAAENLAPEARMRELQAQATAARKRGDTKEVQRIANALSALGGNAQGTDFWKGGPTWVGEKGPEIVNLPRGSQVIPNHKTDDYMSGESGVVNHIGNINISSEVDGKRWLERLTRDSEVISKGLVLGV